MLAITLNLLHKGVHILGVAKTRASVKASERQNIRI